ncbi:MAG: hypothetical protein D6747_03640, partial [Chlorobiota bacterium]
MAEPPSLTIVTYKHIGSVGSNNSSSNASVLLLARKVKHRRQTEQKRHVYSRTPRCMQQLTHLPRQNPAMLFELLLWIDRVFAPPGFGVFRYVTFRSAAAAITALAISFLVGPRIIALLAKRQIGERAKEELATTGNHATKAGTPTMGGLIILLAVIVPTVLWASVANAFVWTIVAVTLWLGAVGFLDDYLKVIR